jgi:putative Ca2+/H+ antiporter (TMEM165/GDT1 family)
VGAPRPGSRTEEHPIHEILIALTVFGVVFVGELPDKTAVASLVLGLRYRPLLVLAGVWTAFVIHVVVAVAAGGLIARLPRTPVELTTAALFLAGAVLLLRSNPDEALEAGEQNAAKVTGERSPRQVVLASFGIVLVAEFGDLTQILVATLAARYDDPIAVGIGGLAALWSVAALAVAFGRTLLKVVPLRRVQQAAAVALLVLAGYSAVSALT